MSIYDLDINSLAVEHLPPDKRYPQNEALVQALLSPLQYDHDQFFTDYVQGTVSIVGVQERILYNGSVLVLEYAVNKKFGTVFRQPPLQSDIYTTNLAKVANGFLIGATEPYSARVGQTESLQPNGLPADVGSSFTFVYLNHFRLNIPVALAGSLNQIRGFVNQYVPASIKFTIVTY